MPSIPYPTCAVLSFPAWVRKEPNLGRTTRQQFRPLFFSFLVIQVLALMAPEFWPEWPRGEFNCALEYTPAPRQRIAYRWEDSGFDASLAASFSEFTAVTGSFFSMFFPGRLHLLE